MRKLSVILFLLCVVTVAKAQYIGSRYFNVSGGYVIDENQIQGSVGYGKVYKNFQLGAIVSYKNMDESQVKAHTVLAGADFGYYLLKGAKTSLSVLGSGLIGFQKADEKTPLIRLEKHKTFVYGYEVGIRPAILLTSSFALTAEYRFSMLFNSIVRNNNYVGIGFIFYM